MIGDMLIAVLGKTVQNTYEQYSCFDPVIQTKIFGYNVEHVVDPILPADAALKDVFCVVPVPKIVKPKKTFEIEPDAAKVTRAVATDTDERNVRESFIKKYLIYSPTTTEQNEIWILIAEQMAGPEIRFLNVENSQMKFLNDNLKDKNFVSSLTNYHKKIVMNKIETLKNSFTKLKINAYSDFKSLRFSFTGKIPSNFEEHLAHLLKEANQEFSNHIRKKKFIRKTDQPELWFRSGFGEFSDQANIAARYSRQTETNDLQLYEKNSLKVALEHKLQAAEKTRQNLRSTFKDTSLLDGNTFHEDVFHIVRKNMDIEQAISDGIKRRFGVSSVSSETVDSLQNYVRINDEFQASLRIPKQEFANLNDAKFGGFSADVLGLGSTNLKGTAEALAKNKNLEEVLVHSRAAEKATTSQFIEQKNYFQHILNKTVAPNKLKIACSGDDCVAVAVQPLTHEEKRAILTELNNSQYAGKYRLAFVADGVESSEARNLLSTRGESIEKLLRKFLDNEIDPNKLKNLTFGIDMQTRETNQGDVKLILAKSRKVTLTSDENWIIQQKFKDTLAEFNKVLNAQYKAVL